MSLSDYPKCWDTPCNCSKGYLGSKNHAYEQMKKDRDAYAKAFAITLENGIFYEKERVIREIEEALKDVSK